jgi:hypothetical protein
MPVKRHEINSHGIKAIIAYCGNDCGKLGERFTVQLLSGEFESDVSLDKLPSYLEKLSKKERETIVSYFPGSFELDGEKYIYKNKESKTSCSSQFSSVSTPEAKVEQKVEDLYGVKQQGFFGGGEDKKNIKMYHLKKRLNEYKVYPTLPEIPITLLDLCQYVSPEFKKLLDPFNLHKRIESLSEEKKFIIFTPACGYMPEAYILLDYLGEELFRKVEILGIDLHHLPDAGLDYKDNDEFNVINVAKKCYPQDQFANVHLYHKDASNPDVVVKLLANLGHESVDFIILRNPNIIPESAPENLRNSNPFVKMIKSVFPRISSDHTDYLFTAYFEYEFLHLESLMSNSDNQTKLLDTFVISNKIPLFNSLNKHRSFIPDKFSVLGTSIKKPRLCPRGPM